MSTLVEKLEARIDFDARGGCWQWTGVVKANGYGSLTVGRRTHNAHRLIYSTLVGEIPVGLVVDHRCRNRACVNPAHLDLVTQRENIMRGRALVSTCPSGHEYDETTPGGHRGCSACRKASMRASNRRRRARARGAPPT